MEINKDYIQRVLKTGGMESTIEGNYVVLHDKTPQGWTVKIAHYTEGISIDVWIQKPAPEFGAWVEVHIPIPATANAYLSGCIRWTAMVVVTNLVHNDKSEQLGEK